MQTAFPGFQRAKNKGDLTRKIVKFPSILFLFPAPFGIINIRKEHFPL